VTTSRLEINLAAIDHNVALIRKATASTHPSKVQLCAIIKQDAYGLGASRIARRLDSLGVDLLAVYCLSEARALAETPIRTPIMVLMPVEGIERNDPLYRLLTAQRLHLTLHSERQAHALIACGNALGMSFPVHIQVDTGMSRGGCLPDEAERLVKLATTNPRFRLAGLCTHFSSPASDPSFTREQARLFRSWIQQIKPLLSAAVAKGQAPCVVHAANTAATFRSSSLHATMVRVGQGLLGYGEDAFTDLDQPATTPDHDGESWASGGPEFAQALRSLRPCARLLSRIVHIHEIPEGWPVGYNRTWHSKRPSRIGIIPVGYADGYPLALSGQSQVRLTNLAWDRPRTVEPLAAYGQDPAPAVWAPLVGRVSMDQITVDLTDAPEAYASVGCEVEVIGSTPGMPNHLSVLAAQAGTITHELLCRLGLVSERHYLFSDEGQGVQSQAAGGGVGGGAVGAAGGGGGAGASLSTARTHRAGQAPLIPASPLNH